MPSPFPGVDPYLESPDLWPERKGSKKTRPAATATITEPLEMPTWLDEEIKEARIEIRVEIDLLRGGAPSVTHPLLVPRDSRVLVSRRNVCRGGRYWPISVRPPLPVIGIPLIDKDPDVPLDLGAVLKAGYDNARCDLSIDSRKPPAPPLGPEDARWAERLLRERGLR